MSRSLFGSFYMSVLGIIGLISVLSANGSAFGENSEKEKAVIDIPADLRMVIGKKLFFEKKQGCATCHGATGKGLKRAEHVDLTKPSTWKSAKIAAVINCRKNFNLDVEAVVVELILDGAVKWNENFFANVGLKKPEEIMSFDKEMIGIHSSAFKRNVRSIYRVLKKNKLDIRSQEIPRLMAQSAFFYISENMFSEKIGDKTEANKCD